MRGRISDYLLQAAERAHGRGWYGLSVRLLDAEIFIAGLSQNRRALPHIAPAVQPAGGSAPVASRRRPYPAEPSLMTPADARALVGLLFIGVAVGFVILIIVGMVR